MKVLLINGSPHKSGCTFTALTAAATTLNEQGIETEIVQTGTAPIRDCIACGECANVCPVKLLPNEVLAGDGERMLGYCIGCGACEYICPSNIPLLKLINKEAKK